MGDPDDNHVLFQRSVKQINLDAKIQRENSKVGKGNIHITRRPVSLDPRLIDSDKGKLQDILKIQSNKPLDTKLEAATKREVEDVIRSYQNRSLSPQHTIETIERRDRLARAAKRMAEDAVRGTQNRSLSPRLLQRIDSNSKVTIDEITEHNRYIKEKQDSNVFLPVITTSPTNYGANSPPYANKEHKFIPAAFQAFQAFQSKRLPSSGDNEKIYVTEGSPSPGGDTGGETDDDYPDKNVLVSKFPFVEDDEISKHKQLNIEAEKKSKKKTLLSKGHLDYLQRLKLTRKIIAEKEKAARDAERAKKKLLMKTQLKLKPPEPKIETPPPEEVPEKPEDERVKLAKVIQSFRYSYAIEDLYNARIRRSFDSAASSSNISDDEVKNGWLVKTLGSQVLNMNMRSLPSTNPFELRRRRQMLRARAEEETRLLRRMSTNDSIATRSSRVHFQEPVSRLQSIYERHGSIQSELKSESGVSGKSEKYFTPRLSVSERRDSLSPGPGILSKRRKSSKVAQDSNENRRSSKIFLNRTAISSESS